MAAVILLAGVVGLVVGGALVAAPAGVVWHRRLQQLHQTLAVVRWDAEHDELTGLANRAAFYSRAARVLAKNPAGRRLVVALVDTDDFKQVNDSYGHHIGDLVLHALAGRLQERIGTSGLVARLGGDEFAALVPIAEYQRAQDVGLWLGRAGEVPTYLADIPVRVTLSVGVALVDGPGDLAVLLHRADVAMYRAKRARLGVAAFDPQLDDDQALLLPGVRPDTRARDEATRAAAGVGQ